MRTRLAALLRRWADRLNPPPDLSHWPPVPTSFAPISLVRTPNTASIGTATWDWSTVYDDPDL